MHLLSQALRIQYLHQRTKMFRLVTLNSLSLTDEVLKRRQQVPYIHAMLYEQSDFTSLACLKQSRAQIYIRFTLSSCLR